jgi:hypothetical protein
MSKPKRAPRSAAAFLGLTAAVVFIAGRSFLSMRRDEPIMPSAGLSEKKQLSDYLPSLRGGRGDTSVYVYRGEQKGGTLLVLGGTHADEPAGWVTAVVLAENIRVRRGAVIIVPRANHSAFSHSDPQEASPQTFAVSTARGPRTFRLGSRLTNPVDQWPDPAVYINPAGQELSGSEVRNLNRCYPGREQGDLTEKIAFAIMELIRRERVDIGLDLHESAPEYPVNNAIVFHENSSELAALAALDLQSEGFEIRLEASPVNLRGLSHREWGDRALIKALLLETPNASQGRLKGRPSSSLVVEGRDKFYARASRLGRLFVPYGDEGISLARRVARHLAAVESIVRSLGELEPDKALAIEGLPAFAEVQEKGLGPFLHPPE